MLPAVSARLGHFHDRVARAAGVNVGVRRRPAPPAVEMVDALPNANEAVKTAASGAPPNGVLCLFYRLAKTGYVHLLSFQG